jgi:hypothetical protein
MRALLVLIPLAALLAAGCSSEGRVTNPKAPGPAVGNTVGAGVGAVAGNVAGAVVGVGEGATAAASQPFKHDPTQRVICHWHEEKTPDGRTIRVPEYYLVDAHGRIIRRLEEREVR